jgi:hypothetical protein
MATKTRKTTAVTKPQRKFIKVDDADHTQIKIQAATKGKTMGEYVAELSRKDAQGK